MKTKHLFIIYFAFFFVINATVNAQLKQTITQVAGKLVKTAGIYTISFDATSGSRRISSGIYFYSITANNFHQTKKMILLK